MSIPTIEMEHAAKFRGTWLYNGKIAVAIDEVTLQFARDFANFVLASPVVAQAFYEELKALEAQSKIMVSQ
jgi:hypothetical protein